MNISPYKKLPYFKPGTVEKEILSLVIKTRLARQILALPKTKNKPGKFDL
jgi:hypothetical protein